MQKSAKERDELIEQLQDEMDMQQADAEKQISSTNTALHKATEEAREKATHAEEAEAAQQKLVKRANEYQACLESVGVNAVSLKEWTQRDAEKQQDVIMLEEQIQKAMDEVSSLADPPLLLTFSAALPALPLLLHISTST